MKKIQHIVSTHKFLFILGGALLVGLWFCLFGQSMFATGKHTAPANPGIVAVQSNASSVTLPTTSKSRRALIPMHTQQEEAIAYTTSYHDMPKAKMTSTSMRIHETSNAQVHTIGSGSGNGGGENIGGNNNKRGIQTHAYSGAIYMPIAFNAVTEVGASNANELASTSYTDIPRPRRVDPYVPPQIPFPDPIGDVAWALMALLAATYAFIIYRRRTRA